MEFLTCIYTYDVHLKVEFMSSRNVHTRTQTHTPTKDKYNSKPLMSKRIIDHLLGATCFP